MRPLAVIIVCYVFWKSVYVKSALSSGLFNSHNFNVYLFMIMENRCHWLSRILKLYSHTLNHKNEGVIIYAPFMTFSTFIIFIPEKLLWKQKESRRIWLKQRINLKLGNFSWYIRNYCENKIWISKKRVFGYQGDRRLINASVILQ